MGGKTEMREKDGNLLKRARMTQTSKNGPNQQRQYIRTYID